MNGVHQSIWIPIAHLLRPQGRRGELLAEPLSDLPGIFATARELILADPGTSDTSLSKNSAVHIEEVWFPTGKNAGRVVLKLSGCEDISTAETVSGKELLLASEHLPSLEPGTFFVGDLVGCTLFDSQVPVGTIVDVEFATGPDGRTRLEDAAPLLAIQRTVLQDDSEPVLVPFVHAWLDSVDIPARRVTMHLPEGLFDTSEAFL